MSFNRTLMKFVFGDQSVEVQCMITRQVALNKPPLQSTHLDRLPVVVDGDMSYDVVFRNTTFVQFYGGDIHFSPEDQIHWLSRCKGSTCYQLPIPMEQVRPLVEFEHEGEDLSAGRGRGRGGHIHGRDRGNGFMVMDYNDEGWNHVHGRGGQNRGRRRGFRGRGRGGYGGRTYYRQENGGYNEEYSVPVQGRGRGRARGRGQGQGRGRDFRSNGPIHAGAVGA